VRSRWQAVSLDVARLAVKVDDIQVTNQSLSLGWSIAF